MTRRKVIVDRDSLGPATTNLQSVAMLLNAPEVEVLGLCVPTGDHWRDQQVRHALRFFEIVGRTEIPVIPGATMPLVATPADCRRWESQHGKLVYNGAWDLARPGKWDDPLHTRDLVEGNPTASPSSEHAATLIARTVRENPGAVSLWCAGPLTDIALALQLEPKLPQLVRELHFMGGAFDPAGNSPEFANSSRREFNLRFDAEAASTVLRAAWPRITCSPIDVSQTTLARPEFFERIATAGTPLSRYLDRYGQRNRPIWDEVAAATWIDETIVTDFEGLVLDVELDRVAHYGDLLSWLPGHSPGPGGCTTRVQRKLDEARVYEAFGSLLSR